MEDGGGRWGEVVRMWKMLKFKLQCLVEFEHYMISYLLPIRMQLTSHYSDCCQNTSDKVLHRFRKNSHMFARCCIVLTMDEVEITWRRGPKIVAFSLALILMNVMAVKRGRELINWVTASSNSGKEIEKREIWFLLLQKDSYSTIRLIQRYIPQQVLTQFSVESVKHAS